MKPRSIDQPPGFTSHEDKEVANPPPFEGDLFRWRLASFSCFCFCFLATRPIGFRNATSIRVRWLGFVCDVIPRSGGSTSSVRFTVHQDARRDHSGYCLLNSGDVKSKKLDGSVNMTESTDVPG